MNIIKQLLNGDLQYSKEELEAEAEIVDEQLAAVPVTEEAVTATDVLDAEEVALTEADDEIEAATEACDDLNECNQSLESLVEFLSMESGDLTQREYALVMTTANSYLAKAGIESDVMSFEETTALTTVPREEAKATLAEKAKKLAAAAIEAVKRLIAAVGEWLSNVFNKVKRIRMQLLALGKALESAEVTHATVELPATYSNVVDDQVLPKLDRASKVILVDRVKVIAQVGHAMASPHMDASLRGIHCETADLEGLPGAPKISGFDVEKDIDKLWDLVPFEVSGSIKGTEPVEYPFNSAAAKKEVASLVLLLDCVLATEAKWKLLTVDLKKAAYNAGIGGVDGMVRRLGVSAAGRMFDQGPKRFIGYVTTVVSLRAGAITYALKHATVESTVIRGDEVTA